MHLCHISWKEMIYNCRTHFGNSTLLMFDDDLSLLWSWSKTVRRPWTFSSDYGWGFVWTHQWLDSYPFLTLMSLFQVLFTLASDCLWRRSLIEEKQSFFEYHNITTWPMFNTNPQLIKLDFFSTDFHSIFQTVKPCKNSLKHHWCVGGFIHWRKGVKKFLRPLASLLALCSLNEATPLFLTLCLLNEWGLYHISKPSAFKWRRFTKNDPTICSCLEEVKNKWHFMPFSNCVIFPCNSYLCLVYHSK